MGEIFETTVDKFTFRVRAGYQYAEAGVWVAFRPDTGTVRVGLSDYRQQASGDVAFVDLPPDGQTVAQGDELANIETVKVDLAVLAPLDGQVVATNPALQETPELVNQDPYGEGWLVELKPARWPAVGLLDAQAYLAVMTQQAQEEANK